MQFLTGLILIALGATVIYYRFKIYDVTGEWTWTSTYLGNTMNAIILFGMILIGMGAAFPFGAFDSFSTTGNITIPSSSSR
jgi:hypothetical protein